MLCFPPGDGRVQTPSEPLAKFGRSILSDFLLQFHSLDRASLASTGVSAFPHAGRPSSMSVDNLSPPGSPLFKQPPNSEHICLTDLSSIPMDEKPPSHFIEMRRVFVQFYPPRV